MSDISKEVVENELRSHGARLWENVREICEIDNFNVCIRTDNYNKILPILEPLFNNFGVHCEFIGDKNTMRLEFKHNGGDLNHNTSYTKNLITQQSFSVRIKQHSTETTILHIRGLHTINKPNLTWDILIRLYTLGTAAISDAFINSANEDETIYTEE